MTSPALDRALTDSALRPLPAPAAELLRALDDLLQPVAAGADERLAFQAARPIMA